MSYLFCASGSQRPVFSTMMWISLLSWGCLLPAEVIELVILTSDCDLSTWLQAAFTSNIYSHIGAWFNCSDLVCRAICEMIALALGLVLRQIMWIYFHIKHVNVFRLQSYESHVLLFHDFFFLHCSITYLIWKVINKSMQQIVINSFLFSATNMSTKWQYKQVICKE